MVITIIGAGIVGLHIANAFRDKGHEVYVLDREPYLAEHTSGRNSGVIHAGIFYPPGSLRERFCIEGNRFTYEWVKKLGVKHIPCGKWVLPEPGQEPDLEPFFDKIRTLPIPEPRLYGTDDVARLEPALRKTRALLIPSTGLIDAAGYVKALSRYIEDKGVTVALNCKVTAIKNGSLETERGEIPFDLAINCAGLFCDDIAKMAGMSGIQIRPCRGDYYVMNSCPVKRPAYHLPYKNTHGLGVHLTPTFDNQLLLGPNAFFIDEKTDYQHCSTIEEYARSVSYYLPRITTPKLQPAYSGNRPKLFVNGNPHPEFFVQKSNRWIHLLGIESPGLTAAPALAKHVVSLI